LANLPPERRPSLPPGDDDDESTPRLPRRVRIELLIFGPLLLFGLIGMPLLIWVAGNRWLGPYTHGQNLHAGPLALLQDFLVSLVHGSAVFWLVALGPAALVLLVRVLIRLFVLSGRRDDRDEEETPIGRGRPGEISRPR